MEDMEEDIVQKKMMFVMHRAPHGSIYSYEGLEVVLITAAYDQDISMVFIGDGVYALKKEQDTGAIGIKSFMETYSALEHYEVEKLYVDEDSLKERGLSEDDLIGVGAKLCKRSELIGLMDEQEVLFPF